MESKKKQPTEYILLRRSWRKEKELDERMAKKESKSEKARLAVKAIKKRDKLRYWKKRNKQLRAIASKNLKLKYENEIKRRKEISDSIEADKAVKKMLLFDKVKGCSSLEDIEALMLSKQQGTEEHIKELNKKLF